MKTNITIPATSAALPISLETARELLGDAAIASGARRFEIETRGPWGVVFRCVGLAVSARWVSCAITGGAKVESYTIYGDRSLSRATQSGYDMEGEVSVGGKKHRAFTSSLMFELPDGRLINAAVLHVCLGQKFSNR